MNLYCKVVLIATCIHTIVGVKVKVVMRSDEDSKGEYEEIARPGRQEHKKHPEPPLLPFIKRSGKVNNEKIDAEDVVTTEKPAAQNMHPNEMIFPLIYKQKNVNSMFKYGEMWYTWAVEKRTDGSSAINYYSCSDEPKRCDDIGWDTIDTLPKCAIQIEALLPEDRACVNTFGVEPHNSGSCDGAEQMKVSEIFRACGPRIRSLWRFYRVGRRPVNVPKPADVNSLFCEDEEECFLTIEYRIHHDRITFSLHEATRGQTFKSALKREVTAEEDKASVVTEGKIKRTRTLKLRKDSNGGRHKKLIHPKSKVNIYEAKGIVKENDSEFTNKRRNKNTIKTKDDFSEDISE